MKQTSSDEASSLVKLGFSTHEALIYKILLKGGTLDVKTLSQKARVLPNALYRLLNKLQTKGLVVRSGHHPARYHAITPTIALEAYIKQREADLEVVKEHLIGQLKPSSVNDSTRIDLVTNTYDFYLNYAKLADRTKSEISIISIGESVPEEIFLANRRALDRGVTIRFIAHKNGSENRQLLISWKKMGLLVRHYPDWGFHLVVFDKNKSLLSVNNPEKTDERTSLIIYSQGMAKSHADYFDSVWNKAVEID
jgi:sugar-specific transcriptional regulator TrmB